jgi:hypothetical protein
MNKTDQIKDALCQKRLTTGKMKLEPGIYKFAQRTDEFLFFFQGRFDLPIIMHIPNATHATAEHAAIVQDPAAKTRLCFRFVLFFE